MPTRIRQKASIQINIAEYKALLAADTQAPPKKKRQTQEDDLSRAVAQWAAVSVGKYPALRWLTHIPNGGKRPHGEAGKLKGMGTKPGVPDFLLPMPHGRWTGLAVELKSRTGSTSPDQKKWLSALESGGWLTGVCRTLDEFIAITKRFFDDSPSDL